MSHHEAATSSEILRPPEFTVKPNADLLNFSSVKSAGTDERGQDLVDVFWEHGGALRQIRASTPAFTLLQSGTKRPAAILTIERAGHIQRLHLQHSEAGSYFTPLVHDAYNTEPVSLSMVVNQLAATMKLSSLRGYWLRRTLELPAGNLPGREGVASTDELLAKGVIDQGEYNLLYDLKDHIISANETPGLEIKRECIKLFDSLRVRYSPLSLKLLRGEEGDGVVVPHVATMPQPTSKMMVELTRAKPKAPIQIHTIAPGREMPRHPIAPLFTHQGSLDTRSLHSAAERWSRHAHVESPADAYPYLERTIQLLGSTAFADRFLKVCIEPAQKKISKIELAATEQAGGLTNNEVRELAAQWLGMTVHLAKKGLPHQDWILFIKEAEEKKVPGFTGDLTLKEYLRDYHIRKIRASYEYRRDILEAERESDLLRSEGEEWLKNLVPELEARSHDPELTAALEAWSTSPDSTRDRAHDHKGYNAGLLHFFEYRGAQKKRARFDLIEEPPTVDGFIAFTNRLIDILEHRYDPDIPQQVAIFEDSVGNQRTYIFLPGEKGEFIVAFQKVDDTNPKFSAMFNRVTQAGFERMVESVLKGEDRGQIMRLQRKIKPVYMRIESNNPALAEAGLLLK